MIKNAEANYRVKIVAQEIAESSNGNPQIVFTITPIGVYDGDTMRSYTASGNFDPRVFMTLTDNTIDWVLDTLEHLGFRPTSFTQIDPGTEGHHSYVDVECDARCTHDAYEGKEREKWNINRGRSSLKAAEKKTLRSLDARFKSKLRASGAATKQPAANTAAPSGNHTQEDPIPF